MTHQGSQHRSNIVERLLNIEFLWSQNLPHVDPVADPTQFRTPGDIIKSLKMHEEWESGRTLWCCCRNVESCYWYLLRNHCRSAEHYHTWGKGFYRLEWQHYSQFIWWKRKCIGPAQRLWTDHILKVIERVVKNIIHGTINIDEMQFDFCPSRGTAYAIFILRQLQEKHLAKHKKLYMAFVDLEKALSRVPRKVLWWTLHVAGVLERLVKVVQAIYVGARSRARVNTSFSEDFEVKVGVH